MPSVTMQPGDIEVGDLVLLKEVSYPYHSIEVKITRIAGTSFQVHCWNPFNVDLWRQWLSMSDYRFIGRIRNLPTAKISKNNG